jgi:hypothetical protein
MEMQVQVEKPMSKSDLRNLGLSEQDINEAYALEYDRDARASDDANHNRVTPFNPTRRPMKSTPEPST